MEKVQMFWIAIAVLSLFVLWWVVAIWKSFKTEYRWAVWAEETRPSWIRPLILTMFIVGCFVLSSALALNAVQNTTTNASTHSLKTGPKNSVETQPPVATNAEKK